MKLKQKLSIFLFVFAMTFCMPLAMPQAYECQAQVTKKDIKSYTNQPYKIINNNIPAFTETEKQNTTAFETYSDLDSLGRCGVAYANICKELMPTSPREDIFIIHPSGWRSGMKWERCHLIGFQLAGENANEKNLITGTHYFNESGMLPFENLVADYVRKTDHHVLYRVTPVYLSKNLVASGVQMEAYSVEDNGKGICFNVFVYNVKPGYKIDYLAGCVTKGNKRISQYIINGTYTKTFDAATVKKKKQSFKIGCKAPGKITYGISSGSQKIFVSRNGKITVKKGTKPGTYKVKVLIYAKGTDFYKPKKIRKTIKVIVQRASDSGDHTSPTPAPSYTPSQPSVSPTDPNTNVTPSTTRYILNTNTKKFHYPDCRGVSQMNEWNKLPSSASREDIIAQGYSPCGICKP